MRKATAMLVLPWLALLLTASAGVTAMPDTLFYNGIILTVDDEDRVAQAVALKDGRILAAGDNASLLALAVPSTQRIDLAGRVMIPGFVDAHSHFLAAGIVARHLVDLNSPPIGTLRDIDELVARLAERAAQIPPGQTVIGWGYDDSQIAEQRHPTRSDLDRASDKHPIVIHHITGHMSVGNSLALASAGITPASDDPPGGRIRRDPASGEPDGLLEEAARFLLLPNPFGNLDAAGYRAAFTTAATMYLAQGVTTAQDAYADRDAIALLAGFAQDPVRQPRLIVLPELKTGLALARGDYALPPSDPSWLRIGAVKLMADGSIQGYTGHLREPYHVPPVDDPDYRGYALVPPESLTATVTLLHAAGLQLAIHGNGDAAIDAILDALEHAQAKQPRDDARPIVIHAQMAQEQQLDRMARLGAIPSFFALHTWYWGDRHSERFLGPKRAARISPAQSAVARDIPFTLHTDTPVVPLEPMRLWSAAVNRTTTSGRVLGADQRISVLQALRALTINAARQHFLDQERGSIEPGKHADLVILSGDPRAVPSRIAELVVSETLLGGQTVYRRSEPAAHRP